MGPYLGNQTDMNVTEILSFGFELELAEGLDERHALNVTHRAPELGTHRQRELKLLPKQHLVKMYTKDIKIHVTTHKHVPSTSL